MSTNENLQNELTLNEVLSSLKDLRDIQLDDSNEIPEYTKRVRLFLNNKIPELDMLLNLNKAMDFIRHNPQFDNEERLKFFDLIIFEKINLVIGKNDIAGLSILTLLKNKTEPNYNILPKINGTNIKYDILFDLIFGRSLDHLKIIMFVEYLKQRGFEVNTLLNYLFRTRVISCLRIYEPKDVSWYLWFLEESKKFNNGKDNIDNILEIFK